MAVAVSVKIPTEETASGMDIFHIKFLLAVNRIISEDLNPIYQQYEGSDTGKPHQCFDFVSL